MPASICSNFSFILENQPLSAAGVTLTNPGRPFRVVSVQVSGTATTTTTIANVQTGNAVSVAPAIPANYLEGWPQTLLLANLDFTATQDIGIAETAGGDLQYVQIICEAVNPEQLAVTLTDPA